MAVATVVGLWAALTRVLDPHHLGNRMDEEAIITINEHTIKLAAHAGDDLAHSADDAGKLPDSQKIDLPPGKYKVTLKVAGGPAQNRAFEVARPARPGACWSVRLASRSPCTSFEKA